jgi:hypothetical protein
MRSPEVRKHPRVPLRKENTLYESLPYNILPWWGIKIGVADTIDNSDFCED